MLLDADFPVLATWSWCPRSAYSAAKYALTNHGLVSPEYNFSFIFVGDNNLRCITNERDNLEITYIKRTIPLFLVILWCAIPIRMVFSRYSPKTKRNGELMYEKAYLHRIATKIFHILIIFGVANDPSKIIIEISIVADIKQRILKCRLLLISNTECYGSVSKCSEIKVSEQILVLII